jgi:hypothetical protein
MRKLEFRTASIRDMVPCPCDECAQKRADAARTNDRNTNDRQAPDPYAEGLKRLLAAESTPESRFAESWAAERTREMQATRAALDAEAAAPRLKTLTVEELSKYRAPDGYAEHLRRMREEMK